MKERGRDALGGPSFVDAGLVHITCTATVLHNASLHVTKSLSTSKPEGLLVREHFKTGKMSYRLSMYLLNEFIYLFIYCVFMERRKIHRRRGRAPDKNSAFMYVSLVLGITSRDYDPGRTFSTWFARLQTRTQRQRTISE